MFQLTRVKMKISQQFASKVNNAAYGELCCCCCCYWNPHAPRKFCRSDIFRCGGEVCDMYDQLYLLFPQKKHQKGFWHRLCWGLHVVSPAQMTGLHCFYHYLSLAPGLHVPNNKLRTSKCFQCHLQTGFHILTSPRIKKIQLSLYHLIWMRFNPPFPIVSVSSNFVSKTYFLRPCHMHTHLDVLCAMLCFMLC